MNVVRLRSCVAAIAQVGLLSTLVSCDDSSSGTPVSGEMTEIRVSLSPAVMPYVPTSLVVTAVDANGLTVREVEGQVELDLAGGSLSLDELTLEKGEAESEILIEAPVTQVVLTVTFGEFTTQTTVDLSPIRPVPGAESASAAQALPSLPYLAREQDYSTDAPDLNGVDLSFNTVTAVFDKGVTVSDLNAILEKHQAGIVAYSPGQDGVAGPMAALRFSTNNHVELMTKLAAFKAETGVIAAAREHDDGERQVISAPSSNAGWTWERQDQQQGNLDYNWGYEAARVPQLWNLNAAAALASAAEGVDRRTVGVVEFGFLQHEDLVFLPTEKSPFLLSLSAKPEDAADDYEHALHVMGVIGATFDNRRGEEQRAFGVDGINPFAQLYAHLYRGSTTWTVNNFLENTEVPRVLNLSLGANWYARDIDPNKNITSQEQIRDSAAVFRADRERHENMGKRLPLIVIAAGNDSEKANLDNAIVDARWNSGLTYAALEENTPGILVVEALGFKIGGGLERASFSNVGGQISASGVDIYSAVANLPLDLNTPNSAFGQLSGTSMAAPHVAGIASFLFSLEPRLSNDEVVQILTSTAKPVEGAAPMVDAFAAALEVDTKMENNKVLRALVDIDDGTEDGNTRYDQRLQMPVFEDSGTEFGPVGDGRVDMRDFRRFRDAVLLIEGGGTTRLNGADDHPKRDLNFDGRVELPGQENVFPRYDFNGDGRISRGDAVPVGGIVDDTATDLEVLMTLFADVDVASADLPGLLDSGDVHIGAADAIGLGDIAAVEFIIVGRGGRPTVLMSVDEQTPNHIVTLPEGTYDVEMRYLDAVGGELARRDYQIEDLLLGEDILLEAPSVAPMSVTVSPASVKLSPGQTVEFSAIIDGVFREEVRWTATGGTITPTGTFTAGNMLGVFDVQAISLIDENVLGAATVTIAEIGIEGTYVGTRVEWDYGDCNSCVPDDLRIVVEADGMGAYTLSYCTDGTLASGFCTTQPWQYQYQVQLTGGTLSGLGQNFQGFSTALEFDAALSGTTITGTAYWQLDCPGGCYDVFEVTRQP